MMIGAEQKKFDVWLANLNPSRGTEVGKVRPVLIIQSDFLNAFNPSTVVCPFSSNPWSEKTSHLLIPAGTAGIKKDSSLLLDQIRALDNGRFIQKIGVLPEQYHSKINQNLKIILDLF